MREVYSNLQVSNTFRFYLIQFDNTRVLKDCEVSRLSIDARDKFESQIFLVFFLQCILACIYKLGTFVYKGCRYFTFKLIDKLSCYSAFHKTVDKRFLKFATNFKSPKRNIRVCNDELWLKYESLYGK